MTERVASALSGKPLQPLISDIKSCQGNPYKPIRAFSKKALGARLERARRETGLSRRELGRAVGLSKDAIGRVERGERVVSVEDLLNFGRILGPELVQELRIALGELHDCSQGPNCR